MSNKFLNGFRKPQRYRIIKGMGLVCLLVLVAMAAIACNRTTKDNIGEKNNIEETMQQPTASAIAEPTPTKEPETTTKPTPTKEPETTAEPTPTKEPDLTTEPTPTMELEDTVKPTPTKEPKPTIEQESTKEPTPTAETAAMSDFVPSEKVLHSTTAFTQGDYLFYKTGELTKSRIASKNLKTSQVTEITSIEDSYFNSSEFYLKGRDIYYHAEGDIYRVGVDGKNKNRIFKGTATILGFYEDDILALDRKNREIIRINKEGENSSLVKLKSVDTLEAVMVFDGIYYINKSTNNTLKGNDPTDRLYYIDFDGKNKTEIHAELDIFDLKTQGDDVFFLAVSEKPEEMNLVKVNNRKASIIYSTTKEELEAQGCNWIDRFNFTLLAVNTTHVYYGVDFNNGKDMNVYSVGTNGENHELFRNAYDIEGMNPSAYFRRGDMEEGYLKIVFDCDEDPVEVYFIDLQDQSTIKFEGGYYLSASIDMEGEYVYYLKSSQYDHYGEMPEAYKYGQSKISELK